jgi:hypothetical protein
LLVICVQVLDYSAFRGGIFVGLICHCRDTDEEYAAGIGK